jgi:signal transduction histidine kinase
MKRLPLKLLWVQFSLAFASVVIIASLALIVIGYLLRSERPPPPPLLDDETLVELRARIPRFLLRSFITIAITSGVLGIAAGVWMSRRMTAPLGALARGVETIGAGNLTYRVAPKGSDEMVALARSFNQMATRLEEAERLRQNLLADVAHELRTPLTVLQGNLRAILDDVYALDKAEVAHLYDQTRHLYRLVNDLHELAQAEAHQLRLNAQITDLGGLVESTAAIFEPIAEAEGVQLQVEFPEEAVNAQVDRARITQVLQNLLANALRHTPAAGSITIRVETINGEAKIAIQDTGEGIESEHLPRIFDRFYRADRARDRDAGGAGLGLAIARALVETHGGHVAAKSDGRGCGSTFTVTLPIV